MAPSLNIVFPFISQIKRTAFLVFISTFLFVYRTTAQHPVFYSLNDENGLPSNEVYQCLQDKNGFMWMGCDAGLFRYDGFVFKQYRCPQQNGRSISGLQLDNRGNIWCRNFAGQLYRTEGEELRLVMDISREKNNNTQFSLDDSGNAWGIKKDTLVQFNNNGTLRNKYELPEKFRKKFVFLDIAYHDHKIFFTSTSGAVVFFDIKAQQFSQIIPGRSSDYPVSLHSFGNRLFIVGRSAELSASRFFEWNGKEPVLISEINKTNSTGRIFNFVKDRNERYWLCTSNGLTKYDFSLRDMERNTFIFPGKNISNLFQDNEGSLWVSTLQNGIFVIPSMDVVRTIPPGSSESNLTSLAVNDNWIAAGGYSGALYLFDKTTRRPVIISGLKKSLSVKKIRFYENKIYVSHGPVSVIMNGRVIGSAANGKGINARDFCFSEDSLLFIAPDGHGSLYSTGTLESIRGENGGGRAVIYNPGEKRVYFALNSGIVSTKQQSRRPVYYQHKPLYISSLALWRGRVYGATLNEGIVEFTDGKISRFISTEENSRQPQLKLIHTGLKYIWAAGDSSLYRIDPSGWRIDKFIYLHGINVPDITGIDSDSTNLYLSTNKGLLEFPQDMSSKVEKEPYLKMDYAESDGNRYSCDSVFRLPYKFRNLNIYLTSVALRSRWGYYYHYRIPEIDSNWQQTPARNGVIRYQSLPPGRYTFQAMAISASGTQSKASSFSFIVRRPLWQQWWLYALLSLIVIMAAGLISKIRLKRLRHEIKMKNTIAASQLSSLKARMNPHFIHNALNSIQSLIIKSDSANANKYLSKFSKLMRRVLENSGKESITLEEEIETLNLYIDLEKLRFGNEFKHELIITKEIDIHNSYVPPLILQPFVENAIKHGLLHKKGEKKLKIELFKEDCLVCRITDNGIGRVRAAEIRSRQQNGFGSFATGATALQMQLLNSTQPNSYRLVFHDLYKEGVPEGTEVTLHFPY